MVRSSARTVDVTVGLGGRTPPRGIRLHRTRFLPDDEITRSTAPRSSGSSTSPSSASCSLATPDAAAHLPSRRSCRATAARVDTRSELERLVYELCDAHHLPLPLVNTVIEGRVRDFHWPHCRLVVAGHGASEA
jgi:hypothetical protein